MNNSLIDRGKCVLTPAAPDPAALRVRLGEGRAQNALPAGDRVKMRRVR